MLDPVWKQKRKPAKKTYRQILNQLLDNPAFAKEQNNELLEQIRAQKNILQRSEHALSEKEFADMENKKAASSAFSRMYPEKDAVSRSSLVDQAIAAADPIF